MRAWRALLWKEFREEWPKVLVVWGLCAAVFALRQYHEFNVEFSGAFAPAIVTGLVVFGIILAMDLVAGENNKGTLPFLLGKPLGAAGVLLPKFAVGAVVMLAAGAGALATVYLDLEGLAFDNYYDLYYLWTARDLGFLNMLLICLTPGLLVYSVVFVGSAVADHPVKGAAIGLLLYATWDFFNGHLLRLLQLDHYMMFDTGIRRSGAVIRIVEDGAHYAMRLGATALGMALCALAAVALLRRFRGASPAWRPVVALWLVLISYSFAKGMFHEDPRPSGEPLAVLTPEGRSYLDMAVVGDLAYMATRTGMAVVDLADPLAPVELAAVEAPLWTMRRIAVVDSLAYVVGTRKGLPSDSLGIAVFDIADPARPAFKGNAIIGPADELSNYWSWDRSGEGLLLGGRRGDDFLLIAFGMDARGVPQRRGELAVEQIPTASRDGHYWGRRFETHVGAGQLWVGYSSGFLAVDTSDLDQLRETTRVELGDYDAADDDFEYHSINPRLVTAVGDRLYVARHWPQDLVEYDISDPSRPRESGYWPYGSSERSVQIVDGQMYAAGWDRLAAWQLPVRGQTAQFIRQWDVPAPLYEGGAERRLYFIKGHFYSLFGRSLMVFPRLRAGEDEQ